MSVKPGQPVKQPSNIFSDIQNEVSAESAPLLQFITKNASFIAGGVLLLLLILGGLALWNWYQGSKQTEAREELAAININLKGQDKEKALSALAEKAPKNMRMLIHMSLGQTAHENKNLDLAIHSYERAAELGEGTALGFAAMLGHASLLLEKGEYAKALERLRVLEEKSPTVAQMSQFKLLLGEAAAKAGETRLAISAYEDLARQSAQREGAYYRSRIAELSSQLK